MRTFLRCLSLLLCLSCLSALLCGCAMINGMIDSFHNDMAALKGEGEDTPPDAPDGDGDLTTPVSAVANGIYYLFEGGALGAVSIKLESGTWTHSDGTVGTYTLENTKVVLSTAVDGATVAYGDGDAANGVLLLNVGGKQYTYRMGLPTPYTLTYSINNDGATYSLVGYTGDITGEVVVPAYYNNKPVTKVGPSVFEDCLTLTKITFPESIVAVADRVFQNCKSLVTATLPKGVTTMGERVFAECEKLKDFVIPEALKKLEERAFYGCKSLTAIRIPDATGSIGKYAFYNCEGLEELHLGNGVSTANDGAFANCTALRTLTIGRSFTDAEYPFYDCNRLESVSVHVSNSRYSAKDGNVYNKAGTRLVQYAGGKADYSFTIPEEVTVIGERAFYSALNLASVTLPTGLTSIGNDAFKGCYKLVEVYNKSERAIAVGGDAYGGVALYAKDVYTAPYTSKLSMENGFLRYVNGSTVILVDYEGKTASVQIPEGVTKINAYAFYNNNTLTSLSIPSTVKSIGAYAFSLCTALTAVTGAEALEIIEERAFASSEKLASFPLPASLVTVGARAFYCCTGLTTLTLGNNVVSVGESAFDTCTGLVSVTVGDSVTTLEHRAFGGCSALGTVHIGKSVGGAYAFFGCSALATVTVSAENTTFSVVGGNVYNKAGTTLVQYLPGQGGTTFAVPNGVTAIGADAFRDAKLLTSVTLPGTLESIGSTAFYNCAALLGITVPASVTAIGVEAFANCLGLLSVNFLGTGLTTVAASTFYNCKALTAITLPEGVTTVSSEAFTGCLELQSVVLPASVKTVQSRAFASCPKLTSVTFGTTSGWYAVAKANDKPDTGTALTVTEAATNATNLTTTYIDYYWKR